MYSHRAFREPGADNIDRIYKSSNQHTLRTFAAFLLASFSILYRVHTNFLFLFFSLVFIRLHPSVPIPFSQPSFLRTPHNPLHSSCHGLILFFFSLSFVSFFFPLFLSFFVYLACFAQER